MTQKLHKLLCVLAAAAIFFTACPLPSYAIEDIDVDAGAAILVDPDLNMVIYEENADKKMYPASTTKIMTALLTLENAKLSDTVTMTKADFTGIDSSSSSGGLKEGETVTVESLLYCLMLPSANEAANALARHVSGSIPDFVKLMNKRAKQLGCTGTHFANPNGLHDKKHYTTARDLEKIAQKAMENKTFATIVNTAQKKLPATNMQGERIIYTTNNLILRKSDPVYYDYCYGIKTGHTTPAGYCLVSTATKSGHTYISVVLDCEANKSGAAKSFTETKRLFQWAFENYTSQTLVKAGETVTEVPVRLSSEKDYVVLATDSDLKAVVPTDLDVDKLDIQQHLPKDVTAPIEAGQKIGSMTVSYGGKEYGSVDLVATSDVSVSKVLYYADKLENFFSSTFFKICCIVILILVLIWLFLFFSRRQRQKKRNARKYRSMQRHNDQRRCGGGNDNP
jgi:D-alanyl-D-alanine carboxypeptidase (penicillin-binding protein 5/6)